MSLLLALAIRGLPSPHGDDTHAVVKDYMGIMEGSGQTLQDPKPSLAIQHQLVLMEISTTCLRRSEFCDAMMSLDTGSDRASVVLWLSVCFLSVRSCVCACLIIL